MAEVGEEWIWLVYCCSHLGERGCAGKVANLAQNNVALQKVFFFLQSFILNVLSCPIKVN